MALDSRPSSVCQEVGCGMPLTRLQLAWSVFDAGSFGFYTVTYNTFAPVWFAHEAAKQGLPPHVATAQWSYAVAASMLISSLLAPFLGAMADSCRARRVLLVTMMCGSIAGMNMALVARGWGAKRALTTIGYACYGLSNPLYNAFLSIVSPSPATAGATRAANRDAKGEDGDGDGDAEDELTRLTTVNPSSPKVQEHAVSSTPPPPAPRDLGTRLSLMSTWVGNLGAGVLLMLVTAFTDAGDWAVQPQRGNHTATAVAAQPASESSMRNAFAAASVWFVVVCMPFLLMTSEGARGKPRAARTAPEPEPDAAPVRAAGDAGEGEDDARGDGTTSCDVDGGGGADAGGITRRFCSRHYDLALFLGASFFINEGSAIVYQMNAIFALNAAHIHRSTIVNATTLNRFVAIACCFAWAAAFQRGRVETRATAPGARAGGAGPGSESGSGRWRLATDSPIGCFTVAVGCTFLAGLLCLVMHHAWQYWLMQLILAYAGTGTFAFARSILSTMTPPGKAAVVFGFYTTVGRAAGSMGPFLFGLIVELTGDQHSGFAVVMLLFGLGTVMLARVDVERGERCACTGRASDELAPAAGQYGSLAQDV